MPCSKQDHPLHQTGLLRALFSQVLKTSKDGVDTLPLRKVFQCSAFLVVKKVFLNTIKVWKVTGTGNEVPIRCCRNLMASLAMLVSLLTATEEVSYKVFPLLLQLSRLSCHPSSDGHNQVHAGCFSPFIPALSSLTALPWGRGEYSHNVSITPVCKKVEIPALLRVLLQTQRRTLLAKDRRSPPCVADHPLSMKGRKNTL